MFPAGPSSGHDDRAVLNGEEPMEGKKGTVSPCTRSVHAGRIAGAAGIIVLALAAIILSAGCTGTTAGETIAVTGTTTPPATSPAQQPSSASGTTDPATIRLQRTVTVPETGIYLRVNYLGAFSGSYTADGTVHEIQSSGDRLFPVENNGQAITAIIAKTDRSATQPLTLEIWKDHTLLASNTTTALFGEARVSCPA